MNALILTVLLAIGTTVSAGGTGHGANVVVSGPSGIVTSHGPIGPAALGLGHGGAAPGYGLGLGHAGVAPGYLSVPGYLGYGGHALGHGVAVQGPATVPAVIAGPSGKILADGLYGAPHYGHAW